MKIAIFHNRYKVSGGEDFVFQEESLLLEEKENVECYEVHNENIVSRISAVITALGVVFNFKVFSWAKRKFKRSPVDVVHVHNYFPLLSPSIFYACKSSNVATVHTLHNYRAICPTALLMHRGIIVEDSIKGRCFWTIKEKVYKSSYLGTIFLSLMVEVHKWIGTWNRTVDRYIALTEFSKRKYVEAGWPANKIVVKPNFIKDPFSGAQKIKKKGGFALFVGRLSEEKGINTLLGAWSSIKLPLKVIGDGPLRAVVEKIDEDNIDYLGYKNKKEVLGLVKDADFIVMPSTWYEGFPMVLVEAFACGTPAIVSKLGSMEEIVKDGVTGLHFETGSADDLAEKINNLIANPELLKSMGENARIEYLDKYTPEKNYEILKDVYRQAIGEANRK
ncbi:glycosyltransferase family 4 protein [Microbulbifer sp. SAOS-129_SWC]|uniref:glycosyltransferase family 4 protein n=1 Tax=Microbulbifer sp. SAOS-129_SWC TaxID=3145235 RepID=UPI003217593B